MAAITITREGEAVLLVSGNIRTFSPTSGGSSDRWRELPHTIFRTVVNCVLCWIFFVVCIFLVVAVSLCFDLPVVFYCSFRVIGLQLDLIPDRPHQRSMSKGSRRNQPVVEETEEEESHRSPGTGGERDMISMFRMLMEEQRKAELAREQDRRREEERREELREEKEREAVRLQEARQLVVEEKAREAARLQEARQLAFEEKEREAVREKEERQIAFEARQFEQQMAIMKAQIELGETANKIHREGQNEDRKRNRV